MMNILFIYLILNKKLSNEYSSGPKTQKKRLWFSLGIIAIIINVVMVSTLSNITTPVSSALGDQEKNKKQVSEKVTFTSDDGVLIVGSYYKPSNGINNSTPSVILLHMLGRDRNSWDDFAQKLGSKGYAAMSIDLRGHGESIKQANTTISYKSFTPLNFKNMTFDIKAAKQYLIHEKDANPNKITIIGASIGANVALNYAASDPSIKSVILLSPGLNYRGVSTMDAIMEYRNPVYIVAAEGDSESARDSKILCEKISCAENLRIFEKSNSHGTDMFSDEMIASKLQNLILSWLDSTFEPQD